jgi:hypothetical protein
VLRIKNNLKIMDDDQMDPVIPEEVAEEEEELDEDGMPKKIPGDDLGEEEEEEEDM